MTRAVEQEDVERCEHCGHALDPDRGPSESWDCVCGLDFCSEDCRDEHGQCPGQCYRRDVARIDEEMRKVRIAPRLYRDVGDVAVAADHLGWVWTSARNAQAHLTRALAAVAIGRWAGGGR